MNGLKCGFTYIVDDSSIRYVDQEYTLKQSQIFLGIRNAFVKLINLLCKIIILIMKDLFCYILLSDTGNKYDLFLSSTYENLS